VVLRSGWFSRPLSWQIKVRTASNSF